MITRGTGDRLAIAAIAASNCERATPSVSPLSVGGLIKHAAGTERNWIGMVLQQDRMSPEDYENNFRLLPDETMASVLEGYDAVARETEEVVRDLGLDHPVPVPRGVPWFPDDIDAWSVRWVLLHMIAETARHAGHADIVREVDRQAGPRSRSGRGRGMAVDSVAAAMGAAGALTDKTKARERDIVADVVEPDLDALADGNVVDIVGGQVTQHANAVVELDGRDRIRHALGPRRAPNTRCVTVNEWTTPLPSTGTHDHASLWHCGQRYCG